MVDVESLSDAELRTKLMEFGFPVMPITGTTRKLMVKKLKLLMENKNKTNNDNRRSLGRYSSEEESDTDVRSTRKDRNRRATMAAPLAQPPASKAGATLRKSLRRNDSDDISEASASALLKDITKTTTKRTTTTKVVKTVQDEFDTGSDSEPEIIENDFDSSPPGRNSYDKKESPVHSTFSPSSPFRFQQSTAKYSPPKTVGSSSSVSSSFSSSFSNKPVSPSRFTTYTSNAGNSDGALDRLNQIRSRLSLGGNTGYERPTYSTPVDNNEEKETPFLSNFTRRLSQLSTSSPKPEYDFKNDIIKEHDTNGAGSYSRSYLGRPTRYRDINRDYYSRHDSNIFKDNMVSFGVLGLAILFFIIVGFMYYGMRSNDNAIDVAGDFIPRCLKGDPNSKPRFNCVIDDDLESAISLFKIIKPELTKRVVSFTCNDGDAPAKPYMTEPDIVNYEHERSGKALNIIQKDLQNLEVLIFKNPDWGISVVQTDEKSEVTEENILKNMEQVNHYRPAKAIALMVSRPDIPWRCSVYNKLYAVFNTLVVMFGAFFLLYTSNLGYKSYRAYQQQRKEEIFAMVERIVDALQSNCSTEEGDGYLVINHVRDMILPINDRKRLESTWQQAVKFINENESRIRTEVQCVQGELCQVWRWLGSPNLNLSSSPRSKTWQGQAFETQSGAVNSLPCSPTPCLKIRGMVDDNDRNFHAIREAVLSKCAHRCRILHCAVDNTSKCVYLKCADQNDAAVAYTNLHGWWYAGDLVTVKYLRLERYMQRFPDSPVSGPPYLKSLSPPTDWFS